METVQNSFCLYKLLDEKEEYIIDTEGDIFYPILSLCSVKETRDRLSSLHFEPTSFLSLVGDTILKFYPKHSFDFFEFVEWYTQKYSQLERVIVNKSRSKIQSQVTTQDIRESLGLSKSILLNSEPFNELEINSVYRESSAKEKGRLG